MVAIYIYLFIYALQYIYIYIIYYIYIYRDPFRDPLPILTEWLGTGLPITLAMVLAILRRWFPLFWVRKTMSFSFLSMWGSLNWGLGSWTLMTGWWFGTCFIFPYIYRYIYILGIIIPTDYYFSDCNLLSSRVAIVVPFLHVLWMQIFLWAMVKDGLNGWTHLNCPYLPIGDSNISTEFIQTPQWTHILTMPRCAANPRIRDWYDPSRLEPCSPRNWWTRRGSTNIGASPSRHAERCHGVTAGVTGYPHVPSGKLNSYGK